MATDNRTLVLPEPGQVLLKPEPMPEPAPGEVLVKTDRTLISTGTELTVYDGEFPDGSHWDDYSEYPTKSGYMNLGTVVETGTGVTDFSPGDRVASFTEHAAYVAADVNECYHVPDDVLDERAQFFAAAEITMHAIRRGRVNWGETVAVFGLGLLGQLAVRILHVAGARPVVGVNRSPSRVSLLPELSSVVGFTTDDDWVKRIETETGGELADVVIEATGNADAVTDELSALRREGRLVVLGCPRGSTEFDFHDHCNWPSYEIIGSHITSHPTTKTPKNPWTQGEHTRLFFELTDEPAMADLGDLVTDVRPAEHAPAAFADLSAGHVDGVSVALDW